MYQSSSLIGITSILSLVSHIYTIPLQNQNISRDLPLPNTASNRMLAFLTALNGLDLLSVLAPVSPQCYSIIQATVLQTNEKTSFNLVFRISVEKPANVVNKSSYVICSNGKLSKGHVLLKQPDHANQVSPPTDNSISGPMTSSPSASLLNGSIKPNKDTDQSKHEDEDDINNNLSKTQVFVISTCSVVIGLFFLVAAMMHFRNYMKRQLEVKANKAIINKKTSPSHHDKNRRRRPRHVHCAPSTLHFQCMTPTQSSTLQELNDLHKSPSLSLKSQTASTTQPDVFYARSGTTLPLLTEEVAVIPGVPICKVTPDPKNAGITAGSSNGSDPPFSITKFMFNRRRCSLTEEIESVMNRYYDQIGVAVPNHSTSSSHLPPVHELPVGGPKQVRRVSPTLPSETSPSTSRSGGLQKGINSIVAKLSDKSTLVNGGAVTNGNGKKSMITRGMSQRNKTLAVDKSANHIPRRCGSERVSRSSALARSKLDSTIRVKVVKPSPDDVISSVKPAEGCMKRPATSLALQSLLTIPPNPSPTRSLSISRSGRRSSFQ